MKFNLIPFPNDLLNYTSHFNWLSSQWTMGLLWSICDCGRRTCRVSCDSHPGPVSEVIPPTSRGASVKVNWLSSRKQHDKYGRLYLITYQVLWTDGKSKACKSLKMLVLHFSRSFIKNPIIVPMVVALCWEKNDIMIPDKMKCCHM